MAIGASHADAFNVLREHHLPAQRVVHVDRDSILYIDPDRKPRTAWLYRNPTSLHLTVLAVDGFQAEPPGSWPLSSKTSPDSSDPSPPPQP